MSSRPTAKITIPPKESATPHTPPPKVTASIPKAALVKAPTKASPQKPPTAPDKPIKAPQTSSVSQPPPKAIPVVAQSSPSGAPPASPRTNVHFRDVVSGAATTTQKVLRGKFVVTATGANQAVLRPLGDEKLGRVIVEYPRGAIPSNGQVVDADSSRLEIVQVSQSPDGTKTVRVKEAR